MNKTQASFRALILLFFTLVTALSTLNLAQAQTLKDKFNFVVDQAESIYPEIFPPTQETFEAQELGFSWFARYYPGTGVYAALNIEESAIYTLGGPWPEPTFIGDLDEILAGLGYSGGSPGGSEDVINAIVDSGSAQCVMLQRPVQGTVAAYNFSSMDADGGNEVTGTITTAYTAVTAESVTTENDNNLTTEGEATPSTTIVTSSTRVENGWIYQTETQTVTSVAGQELQTVTTFDPDLFVSPEQVCAGMAFTSASVSSLTESTGIILPIPATEIETEPTRTDVISIDDVITIDTTSYETINLVTTNVEGEENLGYTINWISNTLGGIPIRTEVYDENDALLSFTELTSLNTP